LPRNNCYSFLSAVNTRILIIWKVQIPSLL
jgi:hypothetical protein